MSRILLVIAAIFLLASCGQEIKDPDNIISEEKLQKVLFDIHLADATLNVMNYNDSIYGQSNYYQQVLTQNNITSQDFDISMRYYSKDPKRLEKIYDGVLSKLIIKEGEITNEMSNDKVDSLKNIDNDNRPNSLRDKIKKQN